MKKSLLKIALSAILCLATVLLPAANAFATDLDTLVFEDIDGAAMGQIELPTIPADENERETEEEKAFGQNPAEQNAEAGENVSVKVEVSPSFANVLIIESSTKQKKRIFSEDGVFALKNGQAYSIIVTAFGYVGKSESYTASSDETLQINLEKASETSFKNLSYEVRAFRLDKNNNGITNAKSPISSDDAVLYWAKKIGVGYDTGAASSPIIVDGYIYCYAGKNILKIDKISGEVVASAAMVGNSSFAIVPMTYAEGKVFVGLSNGRVQAFNAETLESLWVYKDPLGGQPNCPITYSNGYIYTGFWSGEKKDANYSCISVTDEDPENPTEAKLPTWVYTKKGGFYWAEAYVTDDYLFIGTDDGEYGYVTGYASLLSINKNDGTVKDSVTMPFTGDIRCCVVQDGGKLYFTSKGGYFYSVEIDEESGDILEDTLKYIKLDNYHDQPKAPAMSTSSPTIYNGRAYVGVSGISQFGMYSGHNITVIDLNNWEIAYSVPTQGYPQTSAVLTTAYGNDGTVYIYMFDNFTPGKLRILCDKPGATAPLNGTVEETYVNPNNGITEHYQTPPVLFTPYDAQAQYCICTPVVDSDGFIYFKNDSAYLMMLGCKIESLEVVSKPDKTSYNIGETFDPTGMKIVAHYSNGAQKDVTDYVSWSKEPLTADDTIFQIRFEHVMYQDKNGVPGTTVTPPYTTIKLTVGGKSADGHDTLEMFEEKEKRKSLISFTDTIKFNESDGVMFTNKAAGGTFYAAILSDIEMTDLKAEVSGMITAEIVNFDPEKYKTVGELYSVYDERLARNGEEPVVEKNLTYEKAKELANQRNIEGKTTLNFVKCQSYVYVVKFKVDQNYTAAYKSGTYKITAKSGGKAYSTGEITVVSDVSIFNYEYVKSAGYYGNILEIGSKDGYSDFLTAKHGYKYDEAYKAQAATVVSTTAFRAICGKPLTVSCGSSVTVNISSVANNQRGVNFIYNCPEVKKDTDSSAQTKKKTTFALTFYGNQIIESDYTIKWDLGCTYSELLDIYRVKVEEDDVITYYIYKNNQYFDKFTVDYMKEGYTENVVLTLNGEAGTPLGAYTISTTPPAAELPSGKEINPNTGAFVPAIR